MFALIVFKDCYREGNDTVSLVFFLMLSPELRLSRYALIHPEMQSV
jgi:hypothetical protein